MISAPRPGSSRGSDLRWAPASASTRTSTTAIEVPSYYDSLIAKIIVWDETRRLAISRAVRALSELEIDGIPTTRELGLEILEERRVPDWAVHDLVPPRVNDMIGRRAARRQALFLLYQWDLTRQPLASLYEGEIDPFARALAEAVVERAPELDLRITEAAQTWSAERLGVIERNVLRMAIHELDDGVVPVEVAINEAVELAKRYASAEAAGLVNGILAEIVREAA